MRLIDADKILAEFPVRRNHHDEKHGNIYFIDGIETVMEYLDEIANISKIEAEPVRHGEWIDRTAWCGDIGRCEYECSSCGYRVMHKPKSRGDGKGGKFCDNCGAKMGGK